MRSRRCTRWTLGSPWVLALALGAACAHADLEPAPEAEIARGDEQAASDVSQGVRVEVDAQRWPGRADITEEVTPLLVTLHNQSDRPLRVRFKEMQLVSSDGERYAALPPFEIEGEVAAPRLAEGYPPFDSPRFAYDRYRVAPWYSPVYPGLPYYTGSFHYDPLYYGNTFDYWIEVELPTPEMLERALPEGVLDPGGRASGYVYFERVNIDHLRNQPARVWFVDDLVDAQTGESFGEVRIPFTTD